MIWRTRRGRWLDRYGKWHPWFAWHPVLLEPPIDREVSYERTTRAWLCIVWRIGVIVRGQQFWLYMPVGEMMTPEALRPEGHRHLRLVKQ